MTSQQSNLDRFNALATQVERDNTGLQSIMRRNLAFDNIPLQRQRRSSVGNESATGNEPSAKPMAMAVRSRDGSRWIPVADSHLYASTQHQQNAIHPSSTFNGQLEQHQCLSHTCAISRVFETTELVELILGFLATDHLLPLRLTSKAWNRTILTSPYLRLHLFVHPRWGQDPADFEIVPFCIPGLEIKRGEYVHMGQWVIVTMTLDAARRISPQGRPAIRRRSRSIFESLGVGVWAKHATSHSSTELGSDEQEIRLLSIEGLHTTQPPITTIQAFSRRHIEATSPSDRSDSSFVDDTLGVGNEEVPYAKLTCYSGITLGFLAETAQMLLEKRQDFQTITYRTIISFVKPEQRHDKRSSLQRVDVLE